MQPVMTVNPTRSESSVFECKVLVFKHFNSEIQAIANLQ